MISHVYDILSTEFPGYTGKMVHMKRATECANFANIILDVVGRAQVTWGTLLRYAARWQMGNNFCAGHGDEGLILSQYKSAR